MRLWVPYTKPKPMFLTKRFRKLGWGSTRSVVEKITLFWQVWNLFTSGILLRSRLWLGCVRFYCACLQSHSDYPSSHVSAIVFVCPLSTYEQGVRWLWPSCKVLFANILYPVQIEYQFNPPLLSLAMGLGFSVGALFWGFSSDIWGRRCVCSPVR